MDCVHPFAENLKDCQSTAKAFWSSPPLFCLKFLLNKIASFKQNATVNATRCDGHCCEPDFAPGRKHARSAVAQGANQFDQSTGQ
jgi:hypothetical protein